MRTSTVLGSIALALFSNQVLATPPACLLACVAEVSKGSGKCHTMNDVGCICGESSSIHSCLNSKCPNGNSGEAWNSFESSCKGKSNGGSSSSASSSSSSQSSSASSPSKAGGKNLQPTSASDSKSSSNGGASSTDTGVSSTNSGASSTEAGSSKADAGSSETSSPSSTAATTANGAGSSGSKNGGDVVETHVVTVTGQSGPSVHSNYESKYSTVVEGVTKHYTVTVPGSPVTKTVQGGTVMDTVTCSTTLGKRDVTNTISSSSSGAANVLQVGSAALVAAAALLI